MYQEDNFFKLLRLALGIAEEVPMAQDGNEWQALYDAATCQSMLGVCWLGVGRLPKGQQPPMEVALKWASEAERIRGLNQLLNQEAAWLTSFFAEAGRRSMILKGQANALLYPEPLSRQPGDIDIWVEGGRESVVAFLEDHLGCDLKKDTSYHHVHLPMNERGVIVEVHFRPSSGNFSPITNRRLQRWLEGETPNGLSVQVTPSEGLSSINVPSMRFALVMQLSHIQRHLVGGGIGLRQLTDYYFLLQSSTEDDRREVAARLEAFGLRCAAGALMWLLHEVFWLDEGRMLCQPDEKRGEWMLHEVMAGGNFGRHSAHYRRGKWQRLFQGRRRRLKSMSFEPWEAFWCEANFWKVILRTMPERIRLRSLSLAEGRRKQRCK